MPMSDGHGPKRGWKQSLRKEYLQISYISISILSHSPYKLDTRKIAAQKTNRPFKRGHIKTVDYSFFLTNDRTGGFAKALHYHPTIDGEDLSSDVACSRAEG
jgi:hypothetical protein